MMPKSENFDQDSYLYCLSQFFGCILSLRVSEKNSTL